MNQLNGKVALVTGASSGLGASVAHVFAGRGATVFGIARDVSRLAEAFAAVPGGRYASVDITGAQACRQAVAQCVAEFGQLQVLVNLAGAHTMRHTEAMTDDEWNRDLAVNLHGPFQSLSRCATASVGSRRQHRQRRVGRRPRGSGILGGLLRGKARTDRTHARAGGRVHRSTTAGQCGVPGRDVDSAGDRIHRARGRRLESDHAHGVAPRNNGSGGRRQGDCFPRSDDAAAIYGAVYSADNGKSAG
jgi:meso-butanediol dehydrogenase/(S,S)-butanediol dehydrogenase/diacetyl reductase